MAHDEQNAESVACSLKVTLAISAAPRQVLLSQLTLPAGSTVRQALEHSEFWGTLPALDADGLSGGHWSAGIWGRRCKASHVLRDGDRLELVRALVVDPKVARRERYRSQGEKIPKGRQRPSNWSATGGVSS